MSEPRHIKTNRAQGAANTQSHTERRENAAAAQHAATAGAHRTARKKKKRMPIWLPLLIVLGVIGCAAAYVMHYVNGIMESITPESNVTALVQENMTAEEYSGDVVGILVCGIDYEEGRSYGASDDAEVNDGMTDMIMYVQFDVKNGAMNMLQIPRNTLVGRNITCSNTTGNTYKASNYQINSIMKSNTDGIAALADVISNNYRLPIDYYATIDMDALKEMVDLFGGIEVYVPQKISYGGSTIEAGYRNLDGAACEFFVRNRKTYTDSDITRLNMQRYFYSGLFKRIRTASASDIIKLTPVITGYVKTNCDLKTLISLGISFLKVDSGNIMICQAPVFSATALYESNSVLVADVNGTADLLNTYFRSYTGPIEASEMNYLDFEHNSTATSPNVKYMGQLDAEANAAIESGGSDVEGAVTTDEAA